MNKTRSDALKNQDKIIKEIINEPLLSQGEIAKRTGLGKTTVHEHLKEIPNTNKDERIISLTDGDFEIMQRIQEIKKERLQDPNSVDNREVDLWENTASKRYSLFRGDATDKDGGLKAQIVQLPQRLTNVNDE